MVLGSKVRFLLIVFKANLKASSSAPEGPLSMDSNIPPEGRERKSVSALILSTLWCSPYTALSHDDMKGIHSAD